MAAVAVPIATDGLKAAMPLATAALLVAAVVGHYGGFQRLPLAIESPEQAASFRRLWEAVREAEGPILSDNLAPLVIYRKPVLVEPFGLLILKRAALIRTRPMVRDCEAHVFSLVVAEGQLEAVPGLGECLAAHYRVAESIPPYRLLRPDPAVAPMVEPFSTGPEPLAR